MLANQLLLLLSAAYIFIMAEKHSLWKIPVIFIGLWCWFFFRHKTKHPLVWLCIFALLVFDLYHYYFRVANHHFVLTFIVLSVIFYLYHKRSDYLQKNIQVLLVIVILTSAVQKLLSNQFMNGDFYYYLLNRGYMFNVFLNLFPESLEVVRNNTQSILMLNDTDPNMLQSVVLKDIFPNLGAFARAYAWITVAMELLVAVVLFFKPRHTWTHLCFTVMIIGVLCARLETGFMALLAICGVYLCQNLKLRLLYVFIALGCLTLVITKSGFH